MIEKHLTSGRRILKQNPWVQSPISSEVIELLKDIDISATYYQRGTKQATKDLSILEQKHRRWISSILSLDDFQYVYAIAGVTDGLNHWQLTEGRDWQYLKGDYQWPNIISSHKGKEVEQPNDFEVLYISNPQCANGNFLDNNFLQNLKCPVILDCAYLGATLEKSMTMPTNTEQVMFSFSKGWGVVGQRCGLLYTKYPHPTLEPLKKVECWNYNMVKIIENIIDNFSVDYMYNQFKETQIKICNKYGLSPSDTYFLAISEDDYYERRRRKNKEARLCLTPLIKK